MSKGDKVPPAHRRALDALAHFEAAAAAADEVIRQTNAALDRADAAFASAYEAVAQVTGRLGLALEVNTHPTIRDLVTSRPGALRPSAAAIARARVEALQYRLRACTALEPAGPEAA